MGDLLKLILILYVITLIFSMIIAVIKFVVDTWKWHDPEKRVHISESSCEESEVEENGSNIDKSAECDSSVVL